MRVSLLLFLFALWLNMDASLSQTEIKCSITSIDNGEIIGELGDYKENEVLHFSCNRRYNKQTQIPTKCLKIGLRAEFSPVPVCEPTKCKLPLTALDGTRYDTSKTVFIPGDTVSVSCGNRYWISTPQNTSAVSTCTESGEWDISPVCQEVRCRNERHHTVSYWNVYWGQIITLDERVTYRCRTGYYATSNYATCTREGWAPNPLCKAYTCNRKEVENADIVRNDKLIYEYDERVRYQCKDGYEGQFTLTCVRNYWRGNSYCTEKPCGKITIPGASITDNDKVTYRTGEEVRFQCENDPGTQFTVTCQRGNWTGVQNCPARVGCERPPALENGDIISSTGLQYNHNDRAEYVCQQKYTMKGSTFKTCNDGQWIGEMTCLRPCTVTSELINRNNIRFNYNNEEKVYVAHDEGMTFTCTVGTTPIDPQSMHGVCNDGVMSLPTCV